MKVSGRRLFPFDAEGVFSPSKTNSDAPLRTVAVRGAGATVISGGIRLATQMVGTVILARFISPHDYGLVSILSTFSYLLTGLAGNGVTESIVQSMRITRSLANALFWIWCMIGVAVSLGFAALGPLLARIYHEPEMIWLCAGLAFSILASFISAIHYALMQKAMFFAETARCEIIARVASVVVSIILALYGWRCWALVIGICAYPATLGLLVFYLCSWLPGRPRYDLGVGPILRFVLHGQGRYCLNYATSNTDNLLVSWRFSPSVFGYYKRAYDLFCLAASQLVSTTTIVAVSALSRLRDDREQYFRHLLGGVEIIAFLGMGIAGCFTLIGRDIIRMLLGPGWEEAGRIFTWFAPGIGMMMVYGTQGWINLSMGRADRWFRWSIVEWLVTSLLFVIAIFMGPEGVAVAWGISFWLLTFPAMHFALRSTGMSVWPLVSLVMKYVLAAGIATAAGVLLQFYLNWLSVASDLIQAMERIFVLSLCFLLFYGVAIVAVHRNLTPLRNFRRVGRDLLYAKR